MKLQAKWYRVGTVSELKEADYKFRKTTFTGRDGTEIPSIRVIDPDGGEAMGAIAFAIQDWTNEELLEADVQYNSEDGKIRLVPGLEEEGEEL